jgi:hypothetical protein
MKLLSTASISYKEIATSSDCGILSLWMNGTLRSYMVDAPTAFDVDSLLLYTKPSHKAMRYMWVQTHNRVVGKEFTSNILICIDLIV